MMFRIIAILLLGIILQLNAADVAEASFKSNDNLYMGGVSVTSYDNDTILLHNPALINYNKKNISFAKMNIDFYSNKENLIDTLSSFADKSEEEQFEVLSDLVPLNTVIKLNSSPIISIMRDNYAAGLFFDGYIYSALKRQTNPTSYVDVNFDASAAFGFSSDVDLFGGSMLGVSFQFLNRIKAYDDQTGDEIVVLNSGDILDFVNDDPNKKEISTVQYSGFDLNVGFAKEISLFGDDDALFGVALKNVLGTLTGEKIVATETVDAEIKVPLVLTTGISSILPLYDENPYISNPLLAVDYNIVSSDSDVADSLFIGFEQKVLNDVISLKSGINRGYIVGGVSISFTPKNFNLIKFDFGRYVEKLGQASIYQAYTMDSFSLQILF